MHQDSVLSALQLTMIAVVVVASLAAWLIAVFLAARPPHGASTAANARSRDEGTGAAAAQPPSDAGHAPSDARHADKAAT